MRKISRLLMFAGLAICFGGTALFTIDAFIHLPPEAVKVIAMILPFVVGGGLLAAGALLGRAANRDAGRDAGRLEAGAARALGEVPPAEVPVKRARAAEGGRSGS